MADAAKPALPLFPIQLRKVDVGEILYQCHGFSDPNILPFDTFELTVSVGPYEAALKAMQVALTFKSQSAPPNSRLSYPYSLSITVHGEFIVDEEKLATTALPLEKIRLWGEKNGAVVLLPFLRETVHSVTRRSGFQPFIIPLVEVAAFKVKPPPAREPFTPSPATAPSA